MLVACLAEWLYSLTRLCHIGGIILSYFILVLWVIYNNAASETGSVTCNVLIGVSILLLFLPFHAAKVLKKKDSQKL